VSSQGLSKVFRLHCWLRRSIRFTVANRKVTQERAMSYLQVISQICLAVPTKTGINLSRNKLSFGWNSNPGHLVQQKCYTIFHRCIFYYLCSENLSLGAAKNITPLRNDEKRVPPKCWNLSALLQIIPLQSQWMLTWKIYFALEKELWNVKGNDKSKSYLKQYVIPGAFS
jgi:hypothetical protein